MVLNMLFYMCINIIYAYFIQFYAYFVIDWTVTFLYY